MSKTLNFDVADRLAISDLISRAPVTLDYALLAEFSDLFSEDGALILGEWQVVGRAAIFEAVTNPAGSPFKGDPPKSIRHHITTSSIERKDDNHASAKTYFMNISDNGADHSGVYLDDLVRTVDGWRFARRDIRIDWQAENSLYNPLPR